jgi:hypothetical protein
MSSPEKQPSYKEPSSPVGRMQSGLVASLVTPSPEKNDGDGNRFVNDEPSIDKRKPSCRTVAKSVLNNGEHMLIQVTAEMIHCAIWDLERFVLKDSQPLHMVRLVGAIRNFRMNPKYAQINVEDGTGLVHVILWRKEKEYTAQHQMICKFNSHCYICVIGEVEDYNGDHKIIAFDVRPVSSGNEVTHHFWR